MLYSFVTCSLFISTGKTNYTVFCIVLMSACPQSLWFFSCRFRSIWVWLEDSTTTLEWYSRQFSRVLLRPAELNRPPNQTAHLCRALRSQRQTRKRRRPKTQRIRRKVSVADVEYESQSLRYTYSMYSVALSSFIEIAFGFIYCMYKYNVLCFTCSEHISRLEFIALHFVLLWFLVLGYFVFYSIAMQYCNTVLYTVSYNIVLT